MKSQHDPLNFTIYILLCFMFLTTQLTSINGTLHSINISDRISDLSPSSRELRQFNWYPQPYRPRYPQRVHGQTGSFPWWHQASRYIQQLQSQLNYNQSNRRRVGGGNFPVTQYHRPQRQQVTHRDPYDEAGYAAILG